MGYFKGDYFNNNFHRHVTFGTGGIRAKMGLGSNLLNIYTITRITQGLADYLKSLSKKIVIIGYDTRKNKKNIIGLIYKTVVVVLVWSLY
jgi:phosphomannomutase